MDGEPISTCILLALLAQGKEITTVEGLGGEHPVQRAFVEAEAFQCGYCTPGMILTAKSLLEEDPEPTEEKIRNYMGGNLCRCGCYLKIEDAVNLAASKPLRRSREAHEAGYLRCRAGAQGRDS